MVKIVKTKEKRRESLFQNFIDEVVPKSLDKKTDLKVLKSIKYKNDINYIIKNSGPETITREYFALAEEIKKSSLILPSNYFYPFPNFMLNKKIDRYDEVEDISVGIHHWEMSWMKGNILNRINNKLRVIFK